MANWASPPCLGSPRLNPLKTERDEPSQIRWLSPKSHPPRLMADKRVDRSTHQTKNFFFWEILFSMHCFYNLIVKKKKIKLFFIIKE